MAGLYDLIPGLKEAEDQYRADSYEAFAKLEAPICGRVEILPFTPQMFIELDGCDNAVFKKKDEGVPAADLMIFLWRTSPNYCRDAELRRLFLVSLADLEYKQAVNEVLSYLQRTWKGMPLWRSSHGKGPSLGQWPSRLVHMFGKNYGWSEEQTLNTPFRRLWQYANRILESDDPKYSEMSRDAQKIRGDWLRDRNEKRQAEAAGGAN
jgi:hypothetical protein